MVASLAACQATVQSPLVWTFLAGSVFPRDISVLPMHPTFYLGGVMWSRLLKTTSRLIASPLKMSPFLWESLRGRCCSTNFSLGKVEVFLKNGKGFSGLLTIFVNFFGFSSNLSGVPRQLGLVDFFLLDSPSLPLVSESPSELDDSEGLPRSFFRSSSLRSPRKRLSASSACKCSG